MRCAVRPPGRIVPVDARRDSSAIRFAGDVDAGSYASYPGLSASYGQWLVFVRHDGVIRLLFTGQRRMYVPDLHGKYIVDEVLTK
jgi:hypothetical protein